MDNEDLMRQVRTRGRMAALGMRIASTPTSGRQSPEQGQAGDDQGQGGVVHPVRQASCPPAFPSAGAASASAPAAPQPQGGAIGASPIPPFRQFASGDDSQTKVPMPPPVKPAPSNSGEKAASTEEVMMRMMEAFAKERTLRDVAAWR